MTTIIEKRISPSDCTLAIALPVLKEEFLADLQPLAMKDYAKHYRAQIWGASHPEALWIKYCDNFSKLIEEVAQEVERLGTKVIRNVKLGDLPSLLKERDVVSLVFHWRGASVAATDFIDSRASSTNS